MTARPQVNAVGRYGFRMTKAGPQMVRGPIVKKIAFTVRCLFCLARYEAVLGPRIPCPVCGRVEAER